MGPDEQPKPQSSEAPLAADLRALSARVETLERQLARLLTQLSPSPTPIKPQPESLHSPPPPPIAQPFPPTASLENRIGSQLFSRIGIIALLIGATWFLKLAMDNHWIGPLGRILTGLIAGTAIVLWSERFRRHGFNAFSWSLKAAGSGVLYLSLWAAFQLYHLLPATVALAAMILVTAWNAYMAWAQNSELLAAYALAGAVATPLLLSTGGNHEVFLFTYLLAIDLATVALVRLKPWPRLLLGAFPATVAFFTGWYVQFNSTDQLAVTITFVAAFFLTFLSPALQSKIASPITEILLPLANAAFASLALCALLEDANHHALLPWLAILFGAIYLGLMRLPPNRVQTRVASAVHLSLAIVFLTIAIPLKTSGRWITIGWLAEGVALLWISARLSAASPASTTSTPASAHRILRWLSIAALALGFLSLLALPLWHHHPVETAFLNRRFATALFGIAALATAIWIALHAPQHPDEASPTWPTIACGSVIALNLLAILSCVRELDTLFQSATSTLDATLDATLQRSLAVSIFLMLYAAVLLAIGFWKRTAFIRWQALLLLVFTIGKIFVYDMRDLSHGYRAISFFGLGVLLMAISFAYQKDWLALRDTPQPPPNQPHPKPEHDPAANPTINLGAGQ